MNNKILFLLSLILMLSVQTSIANNPDMDLRNAVTELLKKDVLNHLDTIQQDEASISIQFIVTKNKQIRVVSVNTVNPEIQQLVVDKLENAKVDVENVFTKFHYNLTINFLKRA